jgi:molybdate-binding protein
LRSEIPEKNSRPVVQEFQIGGTRIWSGSSGSVSRPTVKVLQKQCPACCLNGGTCRRSTGRALPSMIPKSVKRFSETIMLKQTDKA